MEKVRERGPVADMSSKTRKPVSAAERMRLLRTRRRNGLRSLRVMLHDTEIDCLVAKGYLKPERRQDHAAIQSAIDDFICHALGPEQD
jgi:hypothetical protein